MYPFPRRLGKASWCGCRAPGSRLKARVKIVFEAPKREVVGSAVIRGDGGFDASVVVPAYATPGQHKVQVVGRAPSGQTMTWVEPVTVLAASPIVAVSADGSDLAPPVLLTLALTFPVATWMVLELLALRQRRAGATTSGR